jgi:hypothetical protein
MPPFIICASVSSMEIGDLRPSQKGVEEEAFHPGAIEFI